MKTQQKSVVNRGALKQNAGTGSLMPEGVKKEELYYEIQDGRGFTIRVANMKHPQICPRKGVIQIESLKRTNFKQPDLSCCAIFDHTLKIWFGVPQGHQANGDILWKRFYLSDFKEYNLKNEDEAIEWAIVSRQNFIQGSPYQRGRILYKKLDIEAEAEDFIKMTTMIEKSVGVARLMKLKEWINCARFFGRTPENMSAIKLQSEVYGIAKDQPIEFMAYWDNANRQVVDLFGAANSLGLITYDLVKGWLFKKSLPLGRTKEAAINYIINDGAFSNSLLAEVKQKDTASKIVTGRTNDNNEANLIDSAENKDLLELQIKARLFNIKGFDTMDMDELRSKVEEAEANSVEESEEEEQGNE